MLWITYQGFVRFLIDNQLPRALAKLLQNLGHHAVHVLDVELARVNDLAIWIALKIIVLRARSNPNGLAGLDQSPIESDLVPRLYGRSLKLRYNVSSKTMKNKQK